jgi:hypothetical protein
MKYKVGDKLFYKGSEWDVIDVRKGIDSNWDTCVIRNKNRNMVVFEHELEKVDERPRLIKALKDIYEILERLTLEQKKSLGATVFTIQALIIETLEKSEE